MPQGPKCLDDIQKFHASLWGPTCIKSAKASPFLEENLSKFGILLSSWRLLMKVRNYSAEIKSELAISDKPCCARTNDCKYHAVSPKIRLQMLNILGLSHLTPSQSMQFAHFRKCHSIWVRFSDRQSRLNHRWSRYLLAGSRRRAQVPELSDRGPSYQISRGFLQA